MNRPITAGVVSPSDNRSRRSAHGVALRGTAIATALLVALPVKAVDGCLVLLCFAAPSWRAVSQCVPPITQVLRDLARGRAFPTCSMSGSTNTASHQWSSAPGNCPPQYTRAIELESGTAYSCDFTGAVAVTIDGAAWSRTWWSFGGVTSTEFMPAAKSRLGSWDTRFDDDYRTWLAAQPPAAPPCFSC